jgi:uncharacterized protein YecE (DUF72 family)
MEFGKLSDISKVNWTLPQEDPKIHEVLSHSKNNFKLYVGATAWGNRHYLGKIYPPKTGAEEFLAYYAKYFSCIELNSSHYRVPDVQTVKGWREMVGTTFKFCPKLHKDISHSRQGLTDPNLLAHWFHFIEGLGDNLGPCFIQFHEMFSYADKNFLFRFLELWPKHFKLAIELRHTSWFEHHKILPALTDYLYKRGIGLVITDVAGRRDVLHSSLSTDFSLLRLVGNNLDPSDERRLKDWANRIKAWEMIGLSDFYLFLHQPDDMMTFEFSEVAAKVLDQVGFKELPLKKPIFVEQGNLF